MTKYKEDSENMSTVLPLPEPGLQSSEDRRVISQWFIQHAREELDKGNCLQAGEKAWGAVAQQLKIIGEERGWNHTTHRQLEYIGKHIVVEFNEPELANALSDAYHKGHRNFYENQTSVRALTDTIGAVEEALPVLEALQEEGPRPFAIQSEQQRRRLAELTGNPDLRIGDTSPVGFSKRHHLLDAANGNAQP